MDKSICCKQKGCETSWVSKSDYINQQQGTYKLYSIILHVQVLNVGFQGGRVTHASIVGRRGEATNKGETCNVMTAEHYDVIFLYLEVYSHT